MNGEYGAVFRACRERAGLSQEEMAVALNRDQGCISRFEKGVKKLEFSEALKWLNLTQASEVAVAFFMGMDGLTIMQQIMDVVSSTSIGTIIGGVLCLI